MTKEDFGISFPEAEPDQGLHVAAPQTAGDDELDVRMMLGAIHTELRQTQSKVDGMAAVIGNVPAPPTICSKCSASSNKRAKGKRSSIESTALQVDESAEADDDSTKFRRFLTPPKVAKVLGVSDGTVIGWIRGGELKAINTSRSSRPRYKIDPVEFERFLTAKSAVVVEAPKLRRSSRARKVKEFV